ncbi:MAG: hypothetical protein ACTSV3_03975 [Candidatus Thorarchaeota archaeon]|nr:MAG: hypothetical protein DRO87_08130 [Candidatus Thorarchaeota archaeon]RLI57585.1 MAG: hypothetical protein DRP09_02120 [Candidatus Thorarchaeota archaeon]
MSSLDDRTLDKLADMVINVLWQDLLEVWRAIRTKMDSEGPAAVKSAFEQAVDRFLKGPFESHVEVRWGMNLCVHCNDDNVEKNGIAYVKPNGDGLEFNQCLNCRIGILYELETAKATLDTYTIGLGQPGQFSGISFYWNAIVPEGLKKYIPSYELIQDGRWIGTLSFDESLEPRFLPFESMTSETPRDAEAPWTRELPGAVKVAADAFLNHARYQVEAALALK